MHEKNRSCPVCKLRIPPQRLQSNNYVTHIIYNMKYKCPQHNKGCNFVNTLGLGNWNLTQHINTCTFINA